MFEISPIETSTKLKPFKEPEPEIPSVELVTELVEVELQELRLYVMVGVKYAPFSVADGDMHPRQDLAHFLLVIHDDGLMGRYRPVLFKGGVCVGPVRRDISLTVRRLFYLGCLCGRFQIVYDFHLYVPHNFGSAPFLVGRDFGKAALGHDKDGGLALASTSAFQGTVFLFFRRFSGEEAFVYLHVPVKAVACIPLAHHVTELVHHFPYGLVTLAAQLPLDFPGGYGTLGRRQEKHRGEPVTHGQVASLHHRAGTERGLMTAAAAYPRLVRLVPILVCTTATAAAKAMLLAEAAQGFHAGFLVRIDFGKIQKCQLFHIYSSIMTLYKNCSQRHHWHLSKIKLC